MYWGKIFAKFNFANRVRSPPPGSSGWSGRAYRIMRMRIRCKLFTAALAAAIAGDDSSHDKGPVGLGRSRGAVLKYLKIDILTVERESELETAVSTRVLAHGLKFLIIVREQKIQRVEIHSGRKYSTKKFSPLTSTGEIGENFLLANFLSYTVHNMYVLKICSISKAA